MTTPLSRDMPAFPGYAEFTASGLTKREYIATAILAALVSARHVPADTYPDLDAKRARMAVRMADALLEECQEP